MIEKWKIESKRKLKNKINLKIRWVNVNNLSRNGYRSGKINSNCFFFILSFRKAFMAHLTHRIFKEKSKLIEYFIFSYFSYNIVFF